MLFAAILGLTTGVLLGLAILAVLRSSLSFEDLLFAPLLGIGVVSFILFVQGSLSLAFTTSGAIALGLILSGLSILTIFISKATMPHVSLTLFGGAGYRKSISFALIITPILMALIFVLYFSTYPIVIFYDNIAYTAKSIFLSGILPNHASLSPMEYTNAYPMLYPLQGAWLYLINGAFNDALIRIFPLLFYATFLAAVVVFSRRFTSSLGMAVLAMVFVFSNQNSVFMVEDINANAPLAVYSALALYFSASFFSKQDRKQLVLAGVFAALAAFSRYQGLFLVGSLLVVVVLFSRGARLLNAASFVVGSLVILTPLYLRNADLFGNPIYPFYGPLFGRGFGFFPSAAQTASVLLPTSIVYWSIPVLFFFILACRYLSHESVSTRFLYAATVCYSILIILFGWGLSPNLDDWSAFLPVLVPMCVLATVPFKHASETRAEAALASLFLLAGLIAEYVLNLFPYFGSLSFTFAVVVTVFSLGYLLLRGRRLAEGWYKPASVVFFVALLVFPTYAAANLKFVTVSVNRQPFSLAPQLYVNFSERSTQGTILNGKSIVTLHDLDVVYLWTNTHLPSTARILNPLSPPSANRYYSNLDVVPLDGFELAYLRQYNTTCGLVDQLHQRGIDYVVAPVQAASSSSELGMILSRSSLVLRAGGLDLRAINGC